MARARKVSDSAENKDLILTLNSGSSSLKFGIYRHRANDEEALLTGSADGIARDSGSLQIRSSNGTTLLKKECIHESQTEALRSLATTIREHVQGSPVGVGHRIVHGGPKLREHQPISPHVLEELRAAIHFAPLHIP